MNKDEMKMTEANEYEMIKRLQSALPDAETMRFNFDKIDLATYLYDRGCRQVADDEIVVKKSEYEALLLEQKRLKAIAGRIPCGYELKEITREETAREILAKVDYESNGRTKQITNILRRKYGIEEERNL